MPDGVPPCVSQAFFVGSRFRRDTRRVPAPMPAAKPHPAISRSTKEAIVILATKHALTPHTETSPTFGGLALSPETLRAVHRLGWNQPTPIQQQGIPVMAGGKDMIGQAETGSGENGAYGIPIVERLGPSSRSLQRPILAPPRGLAPPIAGDLLGLGREL